MKTFAVKVNTAGSIFSKKFVVTLENCDILNSNTFTTLITILNLKKDQTITNVIELDLTKENVIEI